MSGGYSSGFRPSANVQTVGPDRIRRNWLETAAFAPDNYRQQNGLSLGLTPATRQAALSALSDEMPYFDPRRDPFEVGRPVQLPSYEEGGLASLVATTPALGSFQQQNDAAVLALDVGGALVGRPMPSNGAQDALSALFGTRPRILGGY